LNYILLVSFLLIFTLGSQNSWAKFPTSYSWENLEHCRSIPPTQDHVSRVTSFCDAKGLRAVISYNLLHDYIEDEELYRDGRLISEKSWDEKGRLYRCFDYSFRTDGEGKLLVTKSGHTEINDIVYLDYRIVYYPQGEDTRFIETLYEDWHFLPNTSSAGFYLYQVDSYEQRFGKNLIRESRFFRDGKSVSTFYYEYDLSRPEIGRPISFKAYESDGSLFASYERKIPYNLNEYAFQGKDPIVVSIIDSDFDFKHPDLKNRFLLNDGIDQVDSDRDGLVDDFFGWNLATNSNNILPVIQLENIGAPFSHGTHVASLIVKETKDVALVGLASPFEGAFHLNDVATVLNKKRIRFNNMSFNDANLVNWKYLKTFIDKTPQTLHIVAAGNRGVDMDLPKNFNYPVSFDNENILVVGSIDSDGLDAAEYGNYQMSSFSSYGKVNVDILAPGYNLKGASLGGGHIKSSGTSFSAPFLLNRGVIAVYRENRWLSNQQIKEILLKTAYVNYSRPFPIRSGGILYPQRAVAVARLMKSNLFLNVTAAALQILNDEVKNKLSQAERAALQKRVLSFWKERQL